MSPTNIPTKQDLMQKATTHAQQVTELNRNITVASGAVVGGPIQNTPNPAPASGGPSS